MKYLFFLVALTTLFSCGTLHSTTYIDPEKSFVLGEGNHGSYSAKIKNAGAGDIEVIKSDLGGNQTSLGILKKGASAEYSVPKNTTVRFKNLSDKEGEIKIKLRGDTGLSMGYE